MDSRQRRQEIYDEIKASSRDAFVLKEMQRLGFWEEKQEKPSLPAELISKETTLRKELNVLLEEKNKYADKEQILKEIRQKRLADAKEKRVVTKAKKEKHKQDKAAQWALTKEKDIIYLGQQVSAGLHNKAGQPAVLLSKSLPVLEDMPALAAAMGITVGQLRHFSFHRKVATSTHYKRFTIPKKSGGKRLISAPMPKLKALQYWILQNILQKVPAHNAAHGFTAQRSIFTNAQQHLNKEVLVNIDLKDFFPTIHFRRVKGLFNKLGYSEQIATVLALICTEPEREELELDNQVYYFAKGDRFLPQGAPTSPAITNIICHKMDGRFTGLARQLRFTYTRYADDLSFSTNTIISSKADIHKSVQSLLWRVRNIIKEEGFTIHPDKLKIMGKGTRQEVTGIVVNKQAGINRKTLHRFRALIYQIQKSGIEGKRWKGGWNILSEMMGYANFVQQVKPALGLKFKQQLQAIMLTPGIQQQMTKPPQLIKLANTHVPPPKEDNTKEWWNIL